MRKASNAGSRPEITLETLRAVGSTGVDFVSMGALTHSASALEVSLILELLA